jgi:cytidylate kinase
VVPVVTISRELGAGGADVARIVATASHAQLVDRELISEVARRLELDEPEVAAEEERPTSLVDRLLRQFQYVEMANAPGWEPPYEDPRFDPRKAVTELTADVIREIAKSGNAVIVGRGGAFVLKDAPRAFHVFLHASEPARRRRIMERFELSDEAAARQIHETDANRAAYIRQLHHADWRDLHHYHLVIDTERLGIERTAEVILSAVRD